MRTGLYIHIPFCEQRCYYCAFAVAVSPEAAFEPYVNRLLREIQLSQDLGNPITIYLGGGTPSLLPAPLLGRILEVIPRTAEEVSLEANPGTLSESKLEGYLRLGITRISLGAQSLEDEDLKRAGRLHQASAVESDFQLLRASGFDNINLDLIAGLPGQKIETWTRNLNRTLELRPEHISIYMLDQEERSAWSKFPAGVPDEEEFESFYTLAESMLESQGYRHYEISNWALPGKECRHNLGYWTGVPYRGFGLSAHSFDESRRFWNTSSMTEYAEKLDRGESPMLGEEVLTPAMKIEEAFMLGLRQAGGVNIKNVSQHLGLVYPDYWHERVRDLESAGWITFDGTTLQLTQRGRLAATSVIGELLWPIPASTFEATH
jgi:oxygen-independent coproporphyrinogen-3 oxidase